ncbi:hypothetical protein FOA32_000313 [Streptococcus sinensis]|nr:hypothetical protein [Streptococcus sinensis]
MEFWLVLDCLELGWLVPEAWEEEAELLDWGLSEDFCWEQASKQNAIPNKAIIFKLFISIPPFIHMITLSLGEIKIGQQMPA